MSHKIGKDYGCRIHGKFHLPVFRYLFIITGLTVNSILKFQKHFAEKNIFQKKKKQYTYKNRLYQKFQKIFSKKKSQRISKIYGKYSKHYKIVFIYR